MIDCIVVPAEISSAFRQAKENTARKGLNAIAMARQAALLLLTVHGYDIPLHAVTNDFYRQALDLDLRGHREYTEAILSAMGGISRSQLSRYKNLLQLSDDATDLADRHSINEGQLRHVTTFPLEEQGEVVRQIIDFDLTVKQVKQLLEVNSQTNEVSSSPEMKRIYRLFKVFSEVVPDEIAISLIEQQGDVHMAKAQLARIREKIERIEVHLDKHK